MKEYIKEIEEMWRDGGGRNRRDEQLEGYSWAFVLTPLGPHCFTSVTVEHYCVTMWTSIKNV